MISLAALVLCLSGVIASPAITPAPNAAVKRQIPGLPSLSGLSALSIPSGLVLPSFTLPTTVSEPSGFPAVDPALLTSYISSVSASLAAEASRLSCDPAGLSALGALIVAGESQFASAFPSATADLSPFSAVLTQVAEELAGTATCPSTASSQTSSSPSTTLASPTTRTSQTGVAQQTTRITVTQPGTTVQQTIVVPAPAPAPAANSPAQNTAVAWNGGNKGQTTTFVPAAYTPPAVIMTTTAVEECQECETSLSTSWTTYYTTSPCPYTSVTQSCPVCDQTTTVWTTWTTYQTSSCITSTITQWPTTTSETCDCEETQTTYYTPPQTTYTPPVQYTTTYAPPNSPASSAFASLSTLAIGGVTMLMALCAWL